MKSKAKKRGALVYILLVLVFMYLPILVVVIYSFNSNTARIPLAFTGWTTRWYRSLFSGSGGWGEALWLSVKVALWSVGLSCVIGTAGAIGMGSFAARRKTSRFDALLENLVTLPIMIPEIILGLCFLVMFNKIGMTGNSVRLITAHITFCIPYVFLNVRSALAEMDTALYDAARDLGASPWRVARDITLPLCRSAVISGAFLALAMSLDDFVISFFVYGAGEGTLPIRIYSSVKVGVTPTVNALCTLIMGTIFVAVALSRYLVKIKGKKA